MTQNDVKAVLTDQKVSATVAQNEVAVNLGFDKVYVGTGSAGVETDPTVPAWAKAETKPTYTAKEVGAISQDDLQSAVDTALTQAKESGEFDGKNGVDGKDGEQGPKGDTGATGPQGPQGEQGIQGEKGADGYTPVKGTDYWTDADKTEIITETENAIDLSSYAKTSALPTKLSNLTNDMSFARTNQANTYYGEQKFLNGSYCPTVLDIASGVGCAFKASRGCIPQAVIGELLMPGNTGSSANENMYPEKGKIKVRAILGGNGGRKISLQDVGYLDSETGWNGTAVLTGTPTAPTAEAGTSTTQIATTEFVMTAIANALAELNK